MCTQKCVFSPCREKVCECLYIDSGEEELAEAVDTVTGLFRQSLASLLKQGKEANLPPGKEIENTNFSLKQKDKSITSDKSRDSKLSQVDLEKRDRPLENESERRGMDVNVKFTFDDSYSGDSGEEELEFVDVTTRRVPEQGAATLDLLERAGNGKSEVMNQKEDAVIPVSLPSPRGTKRPVYFDPQVCK